MKSDFELECKKSTPLGNLCRDVIELDYLSKNDKTKIKNKYDNMTSPNQRYSFLNDLFNSQFHQNPKQKVKERLKYSL